MSDEGALPPLDDEAIEAAKARVLEQATAAFHRDMAELRRLAAKYPDLVAITPGAKSSPEHTAAAETAAPSVQHVEGEHQGFDGTLAGLAHGYRADRRSPYHKVRHSTRENYDGLIKRIIEDRGEARLADLKTRDVQRLHEDWRERGSAMAHSLATMLRALVNFGRTALEDGECERLSVILHNTRFKVQKSRGERLTAEHAIAIRARAHEMRIGKHRCRSIALAQAFQFECMLLQKDVIGEWVPIKETGTSEIFDGDGNKWLRGLRWNEIDENLKLGREKGPDIDLKRAQMVIEELQALYCDHGEPLTRAKLPASGPIIKYEKSGLPYQSVQYRRIWRLVADAAGVPKTIKNMGSRARPDPGEVVQGMESKKFRATEA